jgi:hypothetical protein
MEFDFFYLTICIVILLLPNKNGLASVHLSSSRSHECILGFLI